MDKIKTFSLNRHRRIFALPSNSKDYFFAEVINHPYIEEPYRAEGYAIGYLKTGSIRMQSGLSRIIVKSPAIITLSPSVIRSFSKSSDEMHLDIVFFKETFLLENQIDVFFMMKYDFFEKDERHVIALQKDQHSKISRILELLYGAFKMPNLYEAPIIRNYIYILIHEIAAMHKSQLSDFPGISDSSNPLFARFRNLLIKEFLRQRSVSFYANKLNVTSKHLSKVIKKETGKTAGDWIDEAIGLEAKILLQNKTLTISQVSEHLNFLDQSVFGKFFKAKMGISPLEYRRKFN